MRPEDALAAARERAAAHADTLIPADGLVVRRSAQPSDDELLQWAVVEPDLREVRSTRRLGAPVTRTKQALLRLLAQYHAQVLSVQNRINVHLALRSSLARDEARELRKEVDELRLRLRAAEDALSLTRGRGDEQADARAAWRLTGVGDGPGEGERAEVPADALPDAVDGRTAEQRDGKHRR